MGWWHQGWAWGSAAAWDTCAVRMFLLAAWQSSKMRDSPLTQPLRTPRARLEMGRSCRCITSLAKTLMQPVDCSPSLTGTRVRSQPQNLPGHGLWEPTGVQTQCFAHSLHVPSR